MIFDERRGDGVRYDPGYQNSDKEPSAYIDKEVKKGEPETQAYFFLQSVIVRVVAWVKFSGGDLKRTMRTFVL